MKLVSFALTNYRSIKRTEKITLGNLTILVGPNNEGKSNILRGLVAGAELLTLHPDRHAQLLGRSRSSRSTVIPARLRDRELYDWERDFPISLQSKAPPGKTVFDFEFELSSTEIDEFKSDVKSNLNGLLPIRLSIGPKDYKFEVRKRGPGGTALSGKQALIARFVATHLSMRDIPSVRTASAAVSLVDEMVSRELRGLESTPEYVKAVDAISAIQQPVLDRLSQTVAKMLSTFLPEVKSVEITATDRYTALRRDSNIAVDDGTATDLRYKGDGVQSLAAISLIHHVSQQTAGASELVLAIEEPEAHLHPRAIHQLRAVLQDIASRQQVVLTTHSPLLVNRAEIASNIIVDKSRARRARSIQEVRDALGVRISDSLSAAELILLVEGECDRVALSVLLPLNSKAIRDALRDNRLALDSIRGGGNLTYKLSQARDQLCTTHVFVDFDAAGQAAATRAEAEGLLEPGDRTFATSPGMRESEFEDLLAFSLYQQMILNRYNVDLTSSRIFKGRKRKWSQRMSDAFTAAGQPWDDRLEKRVKAEVAQLVEAGPADALEPNWRSSFDGLLTALENKLQRL